METPDCRICYRNQYISNRVGGNCEISGGREWERARHITGWYMLVHNNIPQCPVTVRGYKAPALISSPRQRVGYLRDAERAVLKLPKIPSTHSNNVTPGLGNRCIFSFKAPSTKEIVDVSSSTMRLIGYRTPPFAEGTHKAVAQLRLYEQRYRDCYVQANVRRAGAQFNHFPSITQQQHRVPARERRTVFQSTYSHRIVAKHFGVFPLVALLECIYPVWGKASERVAVQVLKLTSRFPPVCGGIGMTHQTHMGYTSQRKENEEGFVSGLRWIQPSKAFDVAYRLQASESTQTISIVFSPPSSYNLRAHFMLPVSTPLLFMSKLNIALACIASCI